MERRDTVDYAVTAELKASSEAQLDALQQEGVAAVLDRQLALIEGIAGDDEGDIDVLDYRITVHPVGASVVLALDAPALPAAEQAASSILEQLLQESDLLANWNVDHSEVQITEDEFNLSLAGADGNSAQGEPSDADGTDEELLAALEEALTESEDTDDLDTEEWREVLNTQADQLRAFDLTAFVADPDGDDSEQRARLAAGALVHAATFVTEALYQDELALTVHDATAADMDDDLLVLADLPPCYAFRYDTTFTRAFVLASAAVTARLTSPEWSAPRTVAEALALRMVINAARETLEATELVDLSGSEALFETFAQRALPDRAFEELFEVSRSLDPTTDPAKQEEQDGGSVEELESELRGRGLAIDQWFVPEDTAGLHPYLLLI